MPEAIPYVVHPWEGCSTGTPWGRGPELSVWFKTLFESFGATFRFEGGEGYGKPHQSRARS